MGRMSALHDGSGLTQSQAIPPVSRNGGGGTNTTNGTALDLHGKRGAYYVVNVGTLTGAANYQAFLQTADTAHENDLANATWTNINVSTYPNAGFTTAKTNANIAWELTYDPSTGGSSGVRPVVLTDANVAVIGVVAVTF